MKKRLVGIVALASVTLMVCGPKSDSDLTAKAKAQVESLVRGDFDVVFSNFDDTMQAALPSDKLRGVWDALIGQVGNFSEQMTTRTEQLDQYKVVHVVCEFERAKIDIKVVFDKAGKIAGLFFLPA